MISFHTDQKSIDWAKIIGIKITTISTCFKIFISQQIWKQIEKHVEEIVVVLTIQTAKKKITHGKEKLRIILFHTYQKIA